MSGVGPGTVVALLWLVVIVGVIFAVRARTKRRFRHGPGMAGTVYAWLNEDKRKAIEIIVEERAEARDPEDKEGNLPDFEAPGRSR
jgi:hypothetical protein